MKLTPRTIALTAVKLCLMAILLAVVLRQVHWQDTETVTALGERRLVPGLASTIRTVDPVLYGLGLVCLLGSLLTSAVRWHKVLAILGLPFRRFEVIKLVFIGDFFNNFLLGSLGGDAVKVFLALKSRPQKTVILTSIFADRLIGLIGLTVHAAVMLLVVFWRGTMSSQSLWLPVTPIALVAGVLVVGGVLLFVERLHTLLRLPTIVERFALGRNLQQAAATLRHLFGGLSHLWPVFLLTLCCQCFSINAVALLGFSLHLGLPWFDYLLAVPIIFILSAVPVTPGGIGVLEELCLIYFAAAGNPNKVLILALLVRLTILIGSLPGLFAFWSYGQNRQTLRDGLTQGEE